MQEYISFLHVYINGTKRNAGKGLTAPVVSCPQRESALVVSKALQRLCLSDL